MGIAFVTDLLKSFKVLNTIRGNTMSFFQSIENVMKTKQIANLQDDIQTLRTEISELKQTVRKIQIQVAMLQEAIERAHPTAVETASDGLE